MESIKAIFEWSATGIELVTIFLIVIASIFGTLRFLFHLNSTNPDAYRQFKTHLGKMLILALEFMVAADIIRTVALDQTLNNVLILGLLVAIRTFLSWSLSVEIDGCWPWNNNIARTDIEVAT
jgi:uncharacterized membrane protein